MTHPECTISFEVKELIEAPIFVYYHLTNFYQNHRDYSKSLSYSQLRNTVDSKNLSRCDGALLIEEIFDYDPTRYFNKFTEPFDPKSIASPCGLVAKSYFNGIYNSNYLDSYYLFDTNQNPIFINRRNISNYYSKEYVFKREPHFQHTQWIDVEDESFINWMQMESFPDFIKFYGRIETNLNEGVYSFKIFNSKYNY